MANFMLLLLLSSVVVLMAWRVQGDRQRNHGLEERANAVAALQNARAEYLRGAIVLSSATIAPDAAPLVDMYYDAQVEADKELGRARTALKSLDEAEQVAAIGGLSLQMDELRSEVDAVLDWSLTADQPTRAAVGQEYQPQFWPRVEEMMATLDRMAGEEEAELATSRAEANTALDVTLGLLVASSVVIFMFSIATVGFVIVGIVRPLAALQRSARAIASGHLKERARVSGPEEVTALADDFNRMTEALLERTASLQLSEQRFRDVLDVSRDVVYKLNLREKRYEYVSPSCLSLLGYSPDDFASIGMEGVEQRVHPEDRAAFAFLPGGIAGADAKSVDSRIEYRWWRRDGQYRWFTESRAFVTDGGQEPLAVVGVMRDTTERRAAEEALRENEQRFRSLSALAPIGIFLTDSSGDCVYTNERLQAISGMSIDESMGRAWARVVHPDDRDEIVREATSAAAGVREFAREFRIMDPESKVRWVRVVTRPVLSSDGKQTGRIGIVEDISERKQTEEEKRRAYETVITLLASAAEARDPYTEHHLQRIRGYCEAIAAEMGIPASEAREIGLASLLHDIGKMRVPDSILMKPGSLTAGEWAAMRRHTVWGDELLAGHSWLETARQIARWHHENWDASGYPDGLAGHQIPLSAAIAAVADGFDAMTSDRPYKKAWPPTQAVKEIQAQKGKRYSPQVVDAFIRALEKGNIERIAARSVEEKKAA
jgi:PAS domain S-box-containing protein